MRPLRSTAQLDRAHLAVDGTEQVHVKGTRPSSFDAVRESHRPQTSTPITPIGIRPPKPHSSRSAMASKLGVLATLSLGVVMMVGLGVEIGFAATSSDRPPEPTAAHAVDPAVALAKAQDRTLRVLRTFLPGALIERATGSPSLEANDVITVPVPNVPGEVLVRYAGQELAQRVRIGVAMVDAALEAAAAQNDDCRPELSKMPDRFFTMTAPGSGVFQLLPGVKPSEALRSLFRSGNHACWDGSATVQILMYRAVLSLIGPEAFDRELSDLAIGGPLGNLAKYVEVSGDMSLRANAERRKEMRAGDQIFVKNWDVSPRGVKLGKDVQPVTYLGAEGYYVHGWRESSDIVASLAPIRESLEAERAGTDPRPASLTACFVRVSPKVFELVP